MSSGSFKNNLTNKQFVEAGFSLKNSEGLICHKIQPSQNVYLTSKNNDAFYIF